MKRRFFLATTITAGIVGGIFIFNPIQEAAGQDMRIETEVYSGDSRQPVFENITLFTGNLVYDFSRTGPEKITIFDRGRRRFILLDVSNQKKVILNQTAIEGYVDLLKTREKLSKKEPFLFHPRFEESFDDESKQLVLKSPQMTYKIKGAKSKSDESLKAYIEFADWYSKLSASDPRQMPPFARLELNKAILRHGMIPSEVERVYRPRSGVFTNSIRAKTKHYVVWQLSRKDRSRIDSALNYITEFKEVDLADFYGIQAKTASR